MGIGYADAVIVYNRHVDGLMEEETYYGTRFDGVRVELTQGATIRATGQETADSCVVKIPSVDTPKPYLPPRLWLAAEKKDEAFTLNKEGGDFYVIVRKQGLGINLDLPVGKVESSTYRDGFYQHIRDTYGYAYQVNTVDVYSLIPHFAVGGK